MKLNTQKLAGVLHHQDAEQPYKLRRYFPSPDLALLIEQFWFVDWNIESPHKHIQQNLPDVNINLVINNNKAELIGPVSKVYEYEMLGCGSIIGVKFNIGVLNKFLAKPAIEYVDASMPMSEIVGDESNYLVNELLASLKKCQNDEEKITALSQFLRPFVIEPSLAMLKINQLVSLIKEDADVLTVDVLSSKAAIPVRTIQRYFMHHIGITPKWLIRKYRLSRALKLFENKTYTLIDIMYMLSYTDQSHLIKDWKDILGLTPGQYQLTAKNKDK